MELMTGSKSVLKYPEKVQSYMVYFQFSWMVAYSLLSFHWHHTFFLQPIKVFFKCNFISISGQTLSYMYDNIFQFVFNSKLTTRSLDIKWYKPAVLIQHVTFLKITSWFGNIFLCNGLWFILLHKVKIFLDISHVAKSKLNLVHSVNDKYTWNKIMVFNGQ